MVYLSRVDIDSDSLPITSGPRDYMSVSHKSSGTPIMNTMVTMSTRVSACI
jgi:hypothetical protein